MHYKNGDQIKVGDIFTDGGDGREGVRLKKRAKVLYVDKYNLVWFGLNEQSQFCTIAKSETWQISKYPVKVEISDLTEDELAMYLSSDSILNN